ncbi:hypothetical protein [Virgisporangium aurantiacum]|uniref:Uncharacterized protein n=1 Tax=Virgisporangium aurantiacum TaxID=175570 RepID=A0A8J3ZK79_9ACTN|nr:hypothetical protein [Virgisporangium aurantiacum]GIJ64323.1 hypothetical protein Vau01_118390 [Virgisporangium aurantiacum]
MGASVEIYVKYAGEGQALARRVAELLEVTGYFWSERGFVLAVAAERWIGFSGWAHVDIDATVLGEDGEPGPAEGTAFSPYEFELALSLRGPLERLGWVVFDRLTELGLPMAYGGDGSVFADFLPCRGVRMFPPRTDVEEPGRSWWFEPRLHTNPVALWRVEPPSPPAPAGRAMVFETANLLQMVPVLREDRMWRWGTPVASALIAIGARDIGMLLGSVLGTTARPGRADRAAITEDLIHSPAQSTVDFGSRTVSVEVRSDGAEVVAFPRGPHPGGPEEAASGPVVGALIRRCDAAVEPTILGELVLGLLAALRSRMRD